MHVMINENVKHVVFFSTREIPDLFGCAESQLIGVYSASLMNYFIGGNKVLKEKIDDIYSRKIDISSEKPTTEDGWVDDNFSQRKEDLLKAIDWEEFNGVVTFVSQASGTPAYTKESIENSNGYQEINLPLMAYLDDVKNYNYDSPCNIRLFESFTNQEDSNGSVTADPSTIANNTPSRLYKLLNLARRLLPFIHLTKPTVSEANINSIKYDAQFYDKVKDCSLGEASDNNRDQYNCDKLGGEPLYVSNRLGVYKKEDGEYALCAIYPWSGEFEDNHKELWERLLINVTREFYPNVESLVLMLHDRDLYSDNIEKCECLKGSIEIDTKRKITYSLAVFMHTNPAIRAILSNGKQSPKEAYDSTMSYLCANDKIKESGESMQNAVRHFCAAWKSEM